MGTLAPISASALAFAWYPAPGTASPVSTPIAPGPAMVRVTVLTSITLPATWRKKRGRPASLRATQVRRTSSPAWPLWLPAAVTGRRQESDGPAGSTGMPSVSPRLPTRARYSPTRRRLASSLPRSARHSLTLWEAILALGQGSLA